MDEKIGKIAAYLNKMPPEPTSAWVTAEVIVPTTASTAKLVKRVPQGINPLILILDVEIDPGVGGPAIGMRVARFDEKPAQQEYETAEIHYGDECKSQAFETVT